MIRERAFTKMVQNFVLRDTVVFVCLFIAVVVVVVFCLFVFLSTLIVFYLLISNLLEAGRELFSVV